MAKGDQTQTRNYLNQQDQAGQKALQGLGTNFTNQNNNLQGLFNNATQQGQQDYSNIMGGYSNFLNKSLPSVLGVYGNVANGGLNTSMSPQYKGNVDSAISGYQDFANTGGYSPQDIAAMRARGESQVRSVYDSAQNNIDRAKLLGGGGGLPNYAAATAKLTRDQSQSTSDADTNLEAQLADQIRQGKLSGLSGLGSLGSSQEGLQNQIDQSNNTNRLAGLSGLLSGNQQGLSALSGMNSAYGTAPGAASMYGNQLSNSNNNLSQLQQLQQALTQLYLSGRTNISQIPSGFQQALGNIGSVLGLGSSIASQFVNPGSGSANSGGNGLFGYFNRSY